MEPIVVDVELTPADWDALQRHLQVRLRRRPSRLDLIRGGLLGGVPVLTVFYFLSLVTGPAEPYAILVCALVVGFCWVMLTRLARSTNRPRPGAGVLRPTRFEIDATGIRATREDQS